MSAFPNLNLFLIWRQCKMNTTQAKSQSMVWIKCTEASFRIKWFKFWIKNWSQWWSSLCNPFLRFSLRTSGGQEKIVKAMEMSFLQLKKKNFYWQEEQEFSSEELFKVFVIPKGLGMLWPPVTDNDFHHKVLSKIKFTAQSLAYFRVYVGKILTDILATKLRYLWAITLSEFRFRAVGNKMV